MPTSASPRRRLPLSILCLEDEPRDAEAIRELLADAAIPCEMHRVASEADFLAALADRPPDLILADYTLPGFDATAALHSALRLCPGVPFICVAGTIGEDTAVELLKQGATDYVLKDRMGRLIFAVRRALESARAERARRQAEKALRASEARYADLYENAPDMYLSVEAASTRVLRCNQTLVDTSGYAKEEIIGRPVVELFHPDGLGAVRAAFRQFVTNGVVRNRELLLRRKDGSKLDVCLNTSAIRDASGRISHSRSILRDISDQKRMEGALRRQNEELERFNRLSVGRELRMIALKRQVNELARQLGKPPPYALKFLERLEREAGETPQDRSQE